MYEMRLYAFIVLPEEKKEMTKDDLRDLFVKEALELEKETGIYVSCTKILMGHPGQVHVDAQPIPPDFTKEAWRRVAIRLMTSLKKELGIESIELHFTETNEDKVKICGGEEQHV